MDSDSKVIVSVDLGSGEPDPVSVAERLGIPVEDIDTTFGLLPVELGGSVFAVNVRAESLRLPRDGVEGPFSDPMIEPVR